jgi:hypothetical protein
MSRVNPGLQVVESHQVIAPHPSILGDIVDTEPQVVSCQIVSFEDKVLDMVPAMVN